MIDSNGIAVCTLQYFQGKLNIISDYKGGAYLVWDLNGVIVSNTAGSQSGFDLVSDYINGAIIA